MYCLNSMWWQLSNVWQNLNCSKLLRQCTHYRYFPKVHQRPTKSSIQAQNSAFFWRGQEQKYCSEFTKTRHCMSQIHFFLERGIVPSQTLSRVGRDTPPQTTLCAVPNKPSVSGLRPPRIPARLKLMLVPLTARKQTFFPDFKTHSNSVLSLNSFPVLLTFRVHV